MCTHDLPNMYALKPWACGPQASGIYIRQIPHAHVTTTTCIISHIIMMEFYWKTAKTESWKSNSITKVAIHLKYPSLNV